MVISDIILAIVTFAPAITAIAGIIAAVFKMINCNKGTLKTILSSFDELKTTVTSTKEYEELKDQLKIVNQENVALKKTINELLTKIDHISRDE